MAISKNRLIKYIIGVCKINFVNGVTLEYMGGGYVKDGSNVCSKYILIKSWTLVIYLK